jgi:dihydrolipoamide dehydrogenase
MTSSEVTAVDTSALAVKAKVKTASGEVTLEADVLLSAVGVLPILKDRVGNTNY